MMRGVSVKQSKGKREKIYMWQLEFSQHSEPTLKLTKTSNEYKKETKFRYDLQKPF